MANKTVSLVEDLTADFLKENDLMLWDCEFVKEGRDWFLRLYIDRTDGEYVSTDDCEMVSSFLSKELDERDPIEQNYYLMVSSPGMDRPLLKPSHWRRYVGEKIEIRLDRGKDGTKNITGTLDAYEEPDKANENEGNANEAADTSQARITVTDEKGKVWTLEESEIAKANLAVVF